MLSKMTWRQQMCFLVENVTVTSFGCGVWEAAVVPSSQDRVPARTI